MLTIATERLTLRPWAPDDVDFVFDLYSRWDVQRFIGRVPAVMEHRDDAIERVERLRRFDHPIHGYWAVELRTTAQLVGTILLKAIPNSGPAESLTSAEDTEIGWHFHPDSWGHGYATEAAAAVLSHAFASGLDKVVAVTHPDNLASQRVCERIGMRREGLTSRYYNTECELFIADRA